jgi:hypothetical protein
MGTAKYHGKNDRENLTMYAGSASLIPRKRSQVRGLTYGERDGGIHGLGASALPAGFFALPAGSIALSGSTLVGPPNSAVFRLPDGRFVVPEAWYAGGGGVGRISADQAAALGGRPITIAQGYIGPTTPNIHGERGGTTRGPTPGYIFTVDPSGFVAAGQAGVSYRPGTGHGIKSDLLTLAPVAFPFIVAAGVALAAGGAGAAGAGGGAAAAAEAGAAGAIMPGAAAAAGGATGGLVTAGTTAALTTGGIAAGGGILGTGISLQTAMGIAGAAKTALSLSTQHKSASQSLMQSAQEQYDAGNVAAAQALEAQARENALQAQAYQAQGTDLFSSIQSATVAGIPLLWIVGGGLVLMLLLKKRG